MAQSLWNRARTSVGTLGIAIAAIILAAVLFIIFSFVQSQAADTVDTAAGSKFACTVLSVYDGDGPINCAETNAQGRPVKVRLRGIEAREADNSCRLADLCPRASGEEAKAELTRLAVGRLQCTSFGPSYNNVDAMCFTATGTDISCEMVRRGAATRWPQYDPDGRLLPCVPRR